MTTTSDQTNITADTKDRDVSKAGLSIHRASRDLLDLALDHGWSASYQRLQDTGSDPYVTVTARRGECEVVVTWHTRNTGTYRLSSCMTATNRGERNHRDSSLRMARELLVSPEKENPAP